MGGVSPPTGILLTFLDIDVAVVGFKKHLRASTVNVAVNAFVDSYHIFTFDIFLLGLGGFDLGFDIKVGIDISPFGFHLQAGLDVSREGDVDIAMIGGKRHGFVGGDFIESHFDITVMGVGHDVSGNIGEVNGTVMVFGFDLSRNLVNHYIAIVVATEVQR